MIKIDNIQWSFKVVQKKNCINRKKIRTYWNWVIQHVTSVSKTLLIFHFRSRKLHENQLGVHCLQGTIFSNHPGGGGGGVPWNLFLFVRMNTSVYYHSALLAHFPHEDTKIAEELRGAPRESPHNRNFEETVNLIVCGAYFQVRVLAHIDHTFVSIANIFAAIKFIFLKSKSYALNRASLNYIDYIIKKNLCYVSLHWRWGRTRKGGGYTLIFVLLC